MSIEQWTLLIAILTLIATLGMWYYTYKNDNCFEARIFPNPNTLVYVLQSNSNIPTIIGIKVVVKNTGRQRVVITDVIVHEVHENGELNVRILGALPASLQVGEYIPLEYKRALTNKVTTYDSTWPGFLPSIKNIVALDSMERKWEMKHEDVGKINLIIDGIIKNSSLNSL